MKKTFALLKNNILLILFWLSIFVIYVTIALLVDYYYFIAMGITVVILALRRVLFKDAIIDITGALAIMPFVVSVAMITIKFIKPLLETYV